MVLHAIRALRATDCVLKIKIDNKQQPKPTNFLKKNPCNTQKKSFLSKDNPQYFLQKKTPRQNKRLALTQTAPNQKPSYRIILTTKQTQLSTTEYNCPREKPTRRQNKTHRKEPIPLLNPHPITKKTAPQGTNTACKKKHRDKTNGLHLRKPPRTKNPAGYNCPCGKPTRRQNKTHRKEPIPLAKTHPMTKQTACTYANRPAQKTRPRLFNMA